MLKFIKGHMSSITDIEIFPIVSFLIFFTVFIAAVVWVLTMKKSKERTLAALPIEDDGVINKTKDNRL